MRKQLHEIRKLMSERGIDWLVVPTSDEHGSEYVHDHFKCREYISGFTGSAGTLLIGLKEAYLWTDGRYFLQAEAQLAGSGITLMRQGEPDVPDIPAFLTKSTSPLIAFNGRVLSAREAKAYQGIPGARIVWDLDLPGMIWPDRPPIKPSEPWELPLEVTGMTHEEKLAQIRAAMQENGADWLLLSALDEIAWTWNMRGNDVECNPVFFAYALISAQEARLFRMYDGTYDGIWEALGGIGAGETLWLDEETTNFALAEAAGQAKILRKPTPVQLLKAIKNPAEIASTTSAHMRDGAAMVGFLYWLKREIGRRPLTEIDAARYLDGLRMAQGAFELSFPTIAGYGPDGAIIHYQATEEHNAELKPEGFLLVDSGGQYPDGTTDITRTIALGPLTEKMKECYTLVLKAHIDLAMCRFQPGTTGKELDSITRAPLLARRLDFAHGTGHGVGHVLNVHEGPQTINKRSTVPFQPGMITSDEPGVYLEGEFGIRIENEILCEESDDQYTFRTLTLCPYEREAILPELLTAEERAWLNEYHQNVLMFLAPLLASDMREWLAEVTAEI